MFKLESYVTPLLLSYVNKYIKNLKPEDSQVSLWGGDAVFNNLDLRIDVLEQELQLPFTFVNGHIHELRIHVPWTKLGSEPIIITINTIECILKLKDEANQSCADGSSNSSGTSHKTKDGRKKLRRIELEETPSSYVQSLINRIVNNISIVCNNLILKYVEDDIVLSLNVKSVQIFSANENWEKAFIDLSLPELVLRKVLNLHDLTVCLDRRDGSGKIEAYQDPLLYRCSFEGRLYLAFDGLHAKIPSVTRLDVVCDKLEFSITDQQLPMFVRLLQLCIALYYGELDEPKIKRISLSSDDRNAQIDDNNSSEFPDDEDDYDEQTWSAWAWSMVPQIMPVWEDDEDGDGSRGSKLPTPVFHFGVYVQSASFIFKLAENLDEVPCPQKVTFQPFACLYQEGIFFDAVMRNPDCANIQMGMQSVRLASLGDCICRHPDAAFISAGRLDPTFFIIGDPQIPLNKNHMAGSLFCEMAPENNYQRREYVYEWEDYFNDVHENKLLSRNSAFALDFFYLLELPEDSAEILSTISLSDLENSNVKERCMLRAILCKPELNISGALIHRWHKFLHCIEHREYEPYGKAASDVGRKVSIPTAEDVAALEEFIPYRAHMLVLIDPLIRIFPSDHQKFDVTKEMPKPKKKKKSSSHLNARVIPASLPAVILSANRFEVHQHVAMYPKRIVRTVTTMCLTSENLMHYSHSHLTFKVFGFEIKLEASLQQTQKVIILPACSGTYYIKELLCQKLWKNPFQPTFENFVEVSRTTLRITWPQLLLLQAIYKSWFDSVTDHWLFSQTSVIEDALITTKCNSWIEFLLTGFEWKFSDGDLLSAHLGWIGAIRVSWHRTYDNSSEVITLIHGPEEKENIQNVGYFQDPPNNHSVDFLLDQDRLFNFTLQLPKQNIPYSTAPAVCLIQLKGIAISIDPCVYKWLNYTPRIYTTKNVRTELNSVTFEDAYEGCSKDSIASSSHITGHSESRTQSFTRTDKSNLNKEKMSALNNSSDLCISFYHILKKLTIQVICDSCTIFLPSSTINKDYISSGIVKSFKKAFAAGLLPDTIVFNLPRIRLHNESLKQNLLSEGLDVPITSLEGCNAGDDLFPWSFSMTHMSMYTIHGTKEVQQLIHPIVTSATFALTTKFVPPTSEKLSQLGLCVHADMEPVHLSCSESQAQLVSHVIQCLLNALLTKSLASEVLTSTMHMMANCHQRNSKRAKIGSSQVEHSDVATLPALTEKIDDIPVFVDAPCSSTQAVADKVKFSFWLQWTLPKFTVDMWTFNNGSGTGTWIKFEIDELILSVDVQDIYSKMKLKIESFNCKHFEKISHSDNWKLGEHEGIIFSCAEKLSRTLHIPHIKSAIKNRASSSFENQHNKLLESSHGFFSMTFTRAQCKNVQKRWNNLLREASEEFPDLLSANSFSHKQQYISEIDVKIQAFDIVLCCPILLKGLCILKPLLDIGCISSECDSSPQNAFSYEKGQLFSRNFSNNDLPLLYFNSSTIRVFCPVVNCGNGDEPSGNSKSEIFSKLSETKEQKMKDDLSLLQIDSINISPQVENPLLRIILKSELYTLAQHARILNVPGSQIEDRQYQLDVVGISLTTGSWNDLLHLSKIEFSPNLSSTLHAMGENPALEWNNKVLPPYAKEDEVKATFFPLVSPFDIRVVFAPAVVFEHPVGSETPSESINVCGHSLEVNVTTDLDFTLSLEQILLLCNIYTSNIISIFAAYDDTQNVATGISSDSGKSSSNLRSGEVRLDSGIESDISTLKTIGDPPFLIRVLEKNSTSSINRNVLSKNFTIFNPKHTYFIPYEILLTAGHISFTLYRKKYVEDVIKPANLNFKVKQNTCRKKKPKHRISELNSSTTESKLTKNCQTSDTQDQHSDSASPTLTTESLDPDETKLKHLRIKSISLGNDGYEGSEESVDDSMDTDFEKCKELYQNEKIMPLFYLKFIQPHTFLKCHENIQKLELSCFDINIRGASGKHVINVTEAKMIPVAEDYTISLLDTKPGNADSKTGIPPAFLMLTVTDFFQLPADFKLKIERPLKLGFNVSKYEFIMDTINFFTSIAYGENFCNVTVENNELKKSSLMDSVNEWRNIGKNIRKISFSSVQLVFILETIPHKENAHLIFNLFETAGNIEFKTEKEKFIIDEVIVALSMKDYLVKTSYNNKSVVLFGPSSVNIGAFAVWEQWSLMDSVPRLSCNIENETLLINIGLDSLLCLRTVWNNLLHFAEQVSVRETETPSKVDETSVLKQKSRPLSQTWHDDLRIGTFQYIQDADDSGLQPGPYEIVFCCEQAGQPASMTWCYPEPRILTRIEIYPVPFRAASDLTDQFFQDTKDEVTCVLQYWDPMLVSFTTYRKFQLSETQHCFLELPNVVASSHEQLVLAHKWRVVLDYIDDDDENCHETGRRSLVSPLALAACMRVDSYFDPQLVPSFQVRMTFDLIKVTLSNHFHRNEIVTAKQLESFTFDGSMPLIQDFLFLTFENLMLNSTYRNNVWKVQLNSSMKLDYVEYRNLTVLPILDSCYVKNEINVFSDKFKPPPVVETSTLLDALCLKVSQASIHTLTMAHQLLSQVRNGMENSKLLVMNYYVMCNDTQETIRFGQIEMDENILLHSREMHAYSWRSHKSKQLLHVCIEGMHWKWCEPFDIDAIGSTIRTMEHKGHRATLIITIKCLNKIQKQVLIQGQVHMANCLNRHVEMKLLMAEDYSEKNQLEHCFNVSQENRCATAILETNNIKALQIRVLGHSAKWSKEIMLSEKTKFYKCLIQIPVDKNEGINAWCHILQQKTTSGTQLLIILAPLYIVQSQLPRNLTLNVTTPGSGQSYSVEIEGQGREYQLHCPGDANVTHQLSFQTSPDLEPSKPSLPLSINMIAQVTKSPSPDVINLEDMSKLCESSSFLSWPYGSDEREKEMEELSPIYAEYLKKNFQPISSCKGKEQPNINLEVNLTQKWPYCDTLLINVKPWALISNRTSLQMSLVGKDEEWSITPGEIFASPQLQASIKLGIFIDGNFYYSDNLELTNDDWTFRDHWPKTRNKLPKQGIAEIAIFIDQEIKNRICYLTLDFKVKHGIQIIQVHPSFNIINKSSLSLKLSPCTVFNTDEKVEFLPNEAFHIVIDGITTKKQEISIQPVLLWECFHLDNSEISELEQLQYLSVCNSELGNLLEDWSIPCRLEHNARDSRYTMVVPTPVKEVSTDLPTLMTSPLTLYSHKLNGIWHIIINDDPHPQMVIYNNCSIPLFFGQNLQNNNKECVIVEELELVYKLPLVMPNRACHYTFPFTSKAFPEVNSSENLPKLCFAQVNHMDEISASAKDGNEALRWSSNFDILVENDVFLNVPNYSDVRVHLEKVGHTAHIFIEPVSRIEVSAKEIRSRIKSRNQNYSSICSGKLPHFPIKATDKQKDVLSVDNELSDGDSFVPVLVKENCELEEVGQMSAELFSSNETPDNATPRKKKLCVMNKRNDNQRLHFCTVIAKKISVIFMDAFTTDGNVQELMRINCHSLVCSLRPITDTTKVKIRTNVKHEVVVCLGYLQIDNQLSSKKNYDFPVILVPQERSVDPSSLIDIGASPELALQSVRSGAFLSIEILIELSANDAVCLQNVEVSVKPMMLYIEDSFFCSLMKILPLFVPNCLQGYKLPVTYSTNQKLPATLLQAISASHNPLRIQNLKIGALSMMLSLHASLKLFISLDHTPLVFGSFHRTQVLTTSYLLGHALTVHYLSGALFRAGWVVGSLDIIGNPGGFARAVSSGVADFVKLPYQGLMRGPWAFLTGIAHGSTSLVQQIMAGTLLSITNLANSVSRNMEKLSMDESYRQQNEEIRRSKPDCISQGLRQGLSGFGISLLGAVAGIVDQPLQTIHQAGNYHPSFPIGAVTGLISGVGKGLIGIVAKPLGGAAELVSQAGQGILYGTGWSKMLQIVHAPMNDPSQSFSNSQQKYIWKMLSDLPHAELLLSAEATQINQSGHYVPSVLLLTSHVLFIVNIIEDTQQQAFSVTEVNCVGLNADPTLIYIMSLTPENNSIVQQQDGGSQARIEEFVNKTVKYMLQGPDESEKSESSSRDSPVIASTNASMHFYVNPNIRNTFLALFKIAQNNILGKGFSI